MLDMVPDEPRQRLRVTLHGAVQGVGFRPFVYRLAHELGLGGFVRNVSQGVCLEVEGTAAAVQHFLQRLRTDTPPQAAIHTLETVALAACGDTAFVLQPSVADGVKTAVILPDLATCDACRREIFDPQDRRYAYPFTNCTNCGPRFSILIALPYDRRNTTMQGFAMCARCQAEYHDPHDRRFHAQPNACPVCGPQVALWAADGTVLATRQAALTATAEAIRQGAIVALKGLGGFHLLVDAGNAAAVQRLRLRKHRPDKPLALMYPSLAALQEHCQVTAPAARLLRAAAAPIVLLRHHTPACAAAVAPHNPYLGVMLPYTPLHHLLLHELGRPLVVTSGNQAEEPLCLEAEEALQRLGGIADLFCVHNRPIARPVDDSLVHLVLGRPQILRRARGYAPLPIHVSDTALPAILAVGGHLKNTIALAVGGNVCLSQHLGDLGTVPAFTAFGEAVMTLPRLYEATPTQIACDAHPDYLSRRGADLWPGARTLVQHHYAHVLSCMAEHALQAPVLGVAWDGTGYGLDGSIWGGEFLHITADTFQRVAHMRPFPLPGGDKAGTEPRRAALGLLYAAFGEAVADMTALPPVGAFTAPERRVLHTMLQRGVQTPLTSSVGRLFDAVAALLGLHQRITFEGQAAMAVEFAVAGCRTEATYPFDIQATPDAARIDWQPLLQALLADCRRQVHISHIAAAFHNTLAEIIVAVARRLSCPQVVLTGGCFQNRTLTERAVQRLRAEGFCPFWHQRVPPNDGGLALGQVMAVVRAQSQKE